ncbi:molecular chaperone DnaK [Deinococcus radiodurans]|jgi:chaperone protein DnaK|uniref:Chaperone protein DnaK n=1 Tax=Deinococcus radiodurans (strain ATCC 13939 / DSM 20539 / JCM 16871 / CCUG 27074 / LMG 4051 / NBRC 15346 / NCIMB 9279 / VKM B-1422 / R1) TaxID=243230 RepID=DNAK_DEIRA|nr:molecular chaperone DnaK [Deinococcus radiodurans]Q9RY23.3 RecName: Full=Chaperone protein DnaK; AltName: Full=HSP70; AltName: Full=Heat shock 70 kDa protein; AltName: Full=Heat shock protein 70 [Deinococcus radiodurans R1 = ATCC 13939 = DSM 20539]AAF09718.1 dnaK protein [Deinococcus radiodurans R1 = ATCC 13939 = DSM 20539]ANC72585.1 molecular chaperone DnaK [Deinococcus radiodurans R1 = ATCC 13939 = DSM 20539]QEM72101.1 molecular chaperone DnaK [Deinococcus radiodurans]QIP32910.1 molecular
MAKAVGIDLGTTNSVIAVMEGGRPEVIVNAEGGRTTPSVVAYKGDEILVGQIARRQAALNPAATLFEVKRFIGRRWDEVKEEAARSPFTVKEGPSGSVRIEVNGKDLAPEQVSAEVLRKLVSDASAKLGNKITDAVITVPAYFDNSQREATRQAGEIAGLNVLRVINEPTAAALAYGLERKGNETVLVFDLGGGTFDVTILELGDGVFEVKSTAGDTHLGGADFDYRIVDWLAGEFQKEHNFDLRKDKQALQRLIEAAEKAKIDLSNASETSISLPFITFDPETRTPMHLERSLSRAKFEELTADLLRRVRQPVEQALSDAKLSAGDINEVILVGGSTRIPAVKRIVQDLVGKTPNESVNPDEAVALGAAVQAGIIQGDSSLGDIVLVDVTPLTLGVEVKGGMIAPMITRNTTVPAKKTEIYTTAENNQPGVEINVLQGERPMAADNKSLGRFKLEGIPPMPAGRAQIEVTFDIDANGILHVTAKEKTSGKESSITIENTTTLDKTDVERMVQEAEQNAAADKQRKEKVEKRNNLDSLRVQAVQQLEEQEGAAQDAKDRLKAAADEAEEAVRSEDDSKIADAQKKLEEELRSFMTANQASTQGQPEGTQAQANKADDDVIDADFKPAE